MIKIENPVFPSDEQWEIVVRGVRNPYASHAKSDSYRAEDGRFVIGEADKALMLRLVNAGDPHGKFARTLPVTVEITAPHYWWPEMDQYKIGTCTDSYSKMHSLMNKPFEVDDFSFENTPELVQEQILEHCNLLRRQWLAEDVAEKRKRHWFELLEFLPMSYNQKRTWSGNYQTLQHIYFYRKNHKLPEWVAFCKWIEESVPFNELITAKGAE